MEVNTLGVLKEDPENQFVGEAKKVELEMKIPYPKAVFFIVSTEFCERFCYAGIRTILSIYLTDYLLYSESDSTIIYHIVLMLAYFFPIFGATLADSFLGKYRTILYISFIYTIGNVVLSLAAAEPLGLPSREISLLGLFLIAIGAGGIKPCVGPFGGDQFVLPQQTRQLASYFSLFYFAITSGSFLSSIITPILRANVHCFGRSNCFPLAFGVPAVLMLAAIITLYAGKPFYKHVIPEENLILKVAGCIWNAVVFKIKPTSHKVDHWLDYSIPKYEVKLVEDIKATLRVLFMMLPMPVFWALVDQVGTTWTFLARRMDGYIGFYTILPDQIQFANAFFYLIWVPICEYVLYPAFNKLKFLNTPLQKITCGGVATGVAFLIAACIAIKVESTNPVEPSAGNGQIRIYNTMPCDLTVSCGKLSSSVFTIKKGTYSKTDLKISKSDVYRYEINSTCLNLTGQFYVIEHEAVGYYFSSNGIKFFIDRISKHDKGLPQVRTLVNNNGYNEDRSVMYISSDDEAIILTNSSDSSLHTLHSGKFTIRAGNMEFDTSFYLGGIYAVLVIQTSSTDFDVRVTEVTAANSVHMLFLLPQYVVLAFGEFMFHGPGIEFSYTQSPSSMKSVVYSCWLLSNAVGNLIVVLVEKASFFELASNNYFLYAILMFLDMIIFAYMATRYTYNKTK